MLLPRVSLLLPRSPLRAMLHVSLAMRSPEPGPGRAWKPRPIPVPTVVPSAFEVMSECSEVIDVRSPGEFEVDHIPGAVNLPVLSDRERHEVGLMYKSSPFEAKKYGASLVAANIAAHITEHFSGLPGEYKPLVYCWRGGSRSTSMALVLASIGWQVRLLDGGYKRYRGEVRGFLDGSGEEHTARAGEVAEEEVREGGGDASRVEDGYGMTAPEMFSLRMLSGLTGSGKTELLMRLRDAGEQVHACECGGGVGRVGGVCAFSSTGFV